MKKIVLIILILFTLLETGSAQSVGLVMSGGGARGLAHIGVIKALEENNIPIDYVAGTSMGAIVAALYSMGYTPDEMIATLSSEDFQRWYTGKNDPQYIYYFRKDEHKGELINIKFNIKDSLYIQKPEIRLINPNPMSWGFMEMFSECSAACDNNFDNLFVPFRCVASDVYNKKQVIFSEGNLGDAVRTSMSYPFLFKPIKKDSILLYDGGIYNNFPVDVMKNDFNPDFIIGSIVSKNATLPNERDMMSQIENLMMERSNYSLPDSSGVLLNLELGNVLLLEFNRINEIVEIGYNETLKQIDIIKKNVQRHVDTKELNLRREIFRSKLPGMVFSDVVITGVTSNQQEYIKKEFQKDDETFTLEECKKAYYRLLSDGSITNILPRAIYNKESKTYTLYLDVETSPPFVFKMGGGLSTRNSNQIYFGLKYNDVNRYSKEFIIDGQLGKVYNNVQLMGRFDFSSKIPISFKLIGSFSTIDYYNMDYVFTNENTVALNHQREKFVKIKMMLPFLNRMKAEFGIGFGNIKDEYIPSSIIDLNMPRFDSNETNLFGVSINFEGNTFNSDVFPTSGTRNKLTAHFYDGKEKFYNNLTETSSKIHQSWLQMNYKQENYFKYGKHFSLGTLIEIYYSTRGVSQSYQATMMQAGAFTPTVNSLYNYDPKFRANQYVAGGIRPIYEINEIFQVRTGFYGFSPYREIRELGDGTAYQSKRRFNKFEYIAELNLVCKISNISLNAFLDYTSSHRNRVNVGFTIGWFLFNERFIE